MPYIKGLNGLRAIAVLMVLASHKFGIGQRLALGGAGVRLFFVLSGFLIIGILHQRRGAVEREPATWRSELVRFYENRLYRIWPAYYLLIGVALVLGLTGLTPRLTGEQVLATATFTSNFFQAYGWDDYPYGIGQLWSVAVEEQFYLWAAPCFLLLSRRMHGHICAGVICLAVAASVGHALFDTSVRPAYVGSLTNFGYMALGGLAVLTRWRERRWARFAPLILAVFLISPVAAYLLNREAAPGIIVNALAPILVAPVLLGITAKQDAIIVRLLELRWLRYLGEISYGLYLYHNLIEFRAWNIPGRYVGVLEIVVTIAVAAASFRWLERPLLQARDRRRQRAIEHGAAVTAAGLVPTGT